MRACLGDFITRGEGGGGKGGVPNSFFGAISKHQSGPSGKRSSAPYNMILWKVKIEHPCVLEGIET